MRTIYTTLMISLLVLAVIPGVLAVSVGSGVSPIINTEKFAPLVWMCDHRVVLDDAVEPGRISGNGTNLVERINNYAFQGEQVSWRVLVMDKNGVDKITKVDGTVGSSQGAGNDKVVQCVRETGSQDGIPSSCNAKILEEQITTFDPQTMAFYDCTLTVGNSQVQHGKYWVTVEANDDNGLSGTMAENEFWFFNPVVALTVDGDLTFDNIRPGTDGYSKTMLIGNNAEAGSGVMLDMFISGTDFQGIGGKCPTTNQLSLGAFRYFATNGAYSTAADLQVGRQNGATTEPARSRDAEGYVNIGYGSGFNDPAPFYNGFEILQQAKVGPYYTANVLAPGSEMALTFKLSLPEPCDGTYDQGSIYFWGEAI